MAAIPAATTPRVLLPPPTAPQKRIIVVGAGVFGLSTALHLLEDGYRDVTILDGQDLGRQGYSAFQGADSASADSRKVIRAAYGAEGLHTNLALEAIAAWRRWNDEAPAAAPFFVRAGWARLNDGGMLIPLEAQTLATMAAVGLRDQQYRLDDPAERARALRDGWTAAHIDPFDQLGRGLPLGGVFDGTAGFVRAADACAHALHKIQALGGTVVTGPAGRVAKLRFRDDAQAVTGVLTADGQQRDADVVVVAAGAHTHLLVPGLEDLLTAAAGNLVHVRVPEAHRARFLPDRYPVAIWNYTGVGETGSVSTFPVDENGTLKFLFNGPRWRHLVPKPVFAGFPPAGVTAQVSQPTAWDPAVGTNVPALIVQAVQDFIREHLPELVGADILLAKHCWDALTSYDDFLIDWVPGVDGLLVASGGSNHGFKFLPTLGKYILNVLRGESNEYTDLWKWRKPSEKEADDFRAANALSTRALSDRDPSSKQDLQW